MQINYILLALLIASSSPTTTNAQSSPSEDITEISERLELQNARERIESLEREKLTLQEQIYAANKAFPRSDVPLPGQKKAPEKKDENRRSIEEHKSLSPIRTVITSRARGVEQAIYYVTVQRNIEKIGPVDFPQKNGKKLYGELIVYIPVFEDGTIYEKDGGPRVERSSGNPYLDKAALQIARRAAPFPSIPEKARAPGRQNIWELLYPFCFTREDRLNPESGTSSTDSNGQLVLRVDANLSSIASSAVGQKIRSNLHFTLPAEWTRNDPVEYDIHLAPYGSVKSLFLARSSGLPAFDAAVRRAIYESVPFPPNRTGEVPESFVFISYPRDIASNSPKARSNAAFNNE